MKKVFEIMCVAMLSFCMIAVYSCSDEDDSKERLVLNNYDGQIGSGPVTFTVNGVSFTMIPVQGGTFTMGATEEQGSDACDNEKPAHKVTVSNFCMGETEVTQELWQAVMGNNPSYHNGIDLPVENVSWDDCQEFISRLNKLTGRTFRLPTEAEWEYAAREGNKSGGYKYAGSNDPDEVAWYGYTSIVTTIIKYPTN